MNDITRFNKRVPHTLMTFFLLVLYFLVLLTSPRDSIWSTATQGIEVSPQASKWFEDFLNQGVLLMKHLPSHKKRPTVIETPEGDKKIISEISIDYQDGSPILLTNIQTLKSLNESIPQDSSLVPFEVRNFRPNIVIDKIPSKKEEDFLFVRFSNASRLQEYQVV